MKRHAVLLTAALCLSLLTACGSPGGGPQEPAPGDSPTVSVQPSAGPRETPGGAASLTCRIVDGAEEGNLLLAELGEGLYGGTGVYRLTLTDGLPVIVDGGSASASDLKDGMEVTVSFNGTVQETFPAVLDGVTSLEAQTPAGGTYYDLCGFYLKVLDDLWNVDEALNGATVGMDLSAAPGGLTESEQAALIWRFGELHGVHTVAGTFDELLEQGYITAEPLGEDAPEDAFFYSWEDGCLLSITPYETEGRQSYSLPTLRFGAQKWATSLGAYFFTDCTAVWPEFGTWSDYTVGAEAIS